MTVRSLLPRVVLPGLLLLGGASLTHAQPRGGDDGQRRGPPPEALAACDSLAEGDACSFSGPRGDVDGACRLSPAGESPLACAPDRAPPRR